MKRQKKVGTHSTLFNAIFIEIVRRRQRFQRTNCCRHEYLASRIKIGSKVSGLSWKLPPCLCHNNTRQNSIMKTRKSQTQCLGRWIASLCQKRHESFDSCVKPATNLTRRIFKLAAAARKRCRTSSKGHLTKKIILRSTRRRIKRLRAEMKEISEEQRQIKEGQRQVKEKSVAIELECEQLRKEALLIARQSASTQLRLAIMFQILKARENLEFDKAAILTHALRELIERENQQRKLQWPVSGA